MTKISVPYGKGMQEAVVPDGTKVQVIDINCEKVTTSVAELVETAMENPIGCDKLENLVKAEDKVVIVINDHTRPTPTKAMVDAIIPRLKTAGVSDQNISFIVATGSHRASTKAEMIGFVGEEYANRFFMKNHDCTCKEDMVYLGETASGLPLHVNRMVTEASFVITTGLIAPHHAAGYSGGRKSIVPGVAGLATLKIHHSLPIRPFEPAMGFIYGNPFHEAALEAAKKVRVGFMLNAVHDPHKQNIAFVAGEIEKAHAAGVALCKESSQVDIAGLADVVVTSPGGFPRDSNLYQAQKALSVAEPLCKKGGTFILTAFAEDGIGEGVFREWLVDAKNPEEVVERFRKEGFDVGTNKAFMYARAMTKGRVIIVTDHIAEADLKEMMLDYAPNLQEAINMVYAEGTPEKMIVLPLAVNMVPHVTA